MRLTNNSLHIIQDARQSQDYVGGAAFLFFTKFSDPPLRQLYHTRRNEIVRCKIIGQVTPEGFYHDSYWRLKIEAPNQSLYSNLYHDYNSATETLDALEEYSMIPGKEDRRQDAETRLLQEDDENKIQLAFIQVNPYIMCLSLCSV